MIREQFSRDISALDRVFDFVDRFLSENSVAVDVAYSVKLAIEEIFTNFVKYNLNGGNDIDIELDCTNVRLTVKLQDHGVERFDITEVAAIDTDLPLSDRKPGGLGLHLARHAMDQIDYEYDNRTSTIIMTKYLEK